MARENFYIILELPLDPPEEDQAVIEKVIEQKRLEWSKQTADFKKGPVYRGYTAMVPTMHKVMEDDGLRKREQQEAYQIMYERARHMLAIIEKRGYLYESEIQNIGEHLCGNEGIVRKACKVRIIEDEGMETGRNKRPEGADRFQVFQVYLDTLNKKDYYDFINYRGTMSARVQDMPTYRLLELVRSMRIVYPKHTPEESAVEKLCAECEKTFATKEEKEKYDEYLLWKKTEDIFLQVQIATELTKVLDESQCKEALKLLYEAVRDSEKSLQLLKGYCRQNGIAMEYVDRGRGHGTRQMYGRNRTQAATKFSEEAMVKKASSTEVEQTQPNMAINLKVMVDTVKRCNYISWEKTTQDISVNYLVVRKRGNGPNTINDGELLGTVSGCTYTDATIYPGRLYYYAVFAVKRGVYSKGITTQMGYLNLFEVQDAVIEEKEGKVSLSWTQNYRECRVAVFKQEGNAPMDYGEGRLCYNAGQMSFQDADVKKESTYYYRIFTTINVNGKRYHSKGVIVSITVKGQKNRGINRNQPSEARAPKEEAKKEQDVQEKQGNESGIRSRRPEDINIKPTVTERKQEETRMPPLRGPAEYMKQEPRVEQDHQIIYDVKVRKGIFKAKGVEIIFTSQSEQFELPPLLIVAQKEFPPARKENGVLIGTIEKRLVTGKYSYEIPFQVLQGLEYIKLFLANESDEDNYELHLKYGSSSKIE